MPYVRVSTQYAGACHASSVLAIDYQSFKPAWTLKEMEGFAIAPHNVLRVALFENEVVGFAGFMMHDDAIEIYRMAVSPRWRFNSVGRQLVESVAQRLGHRPQLLCHVHECNLMGARFFARLGFASRLCRNTQPATDQEPARDTYLFSWNTPVVDRLARYAKQARGKQ